MTTLSTLTGTMRGTQWRNIINTNFTNINTDLVSAESDILDLQDNQDDATTIKNGFVRMSTAPVDSNNPIAVGGNDTRVPTQSENDAMVGTYGTPSSSNKFVTQQDPVNTSNMLITTNQTVAGIKTFSTIPVLPASDPTTSNQLVRKSYVDALFANF